LDHSGDEEMEDCRKLHNVELHKFYSSPSIITIINLMRKAWAGYVVRMKKYVLGLGGKARRKENTWNTYIILRWILKG
jgi:hypothetical protein